MHHEPASHEAGASAVGDRALAPADGRTSRLYLFAGTFAALSHANYRLYVSGKLISLIGFWMQSVAQGWLVYQLTNSPLYLGLVGFAASIPVLFLSLGAGVVVDRVPRRTLLIATQAVAMVLALALAGLVFTNLIEPWHVLVLSFLLGVNNSFDGTARQAFVKDMVGKDDMMNAIALNSAMFNLSRIIGPALAGIILVAAGPAWCFLLNGLGYVAAIAAMLRMQISPPAPPPRRSTMVSEAYEAIHYIRSSQTVSMLIILVAVSSLFGFSYVTLLPAYARDVLAVNAQGLGLLTTASGVGALAGALMVASLGRSRHKGLMLTAGNLLFPSLLLALSVSHSYDVSLFLLVGSGWAFMVQNATANTLVQSTVPDHLRGRVMSVYMLGFFGLSPIGSLQAGLLAQHFGVPVGIGLGAVIALSFALYFLWRMPRLRTLH